MNERIKQIADQCMVEVKNVPCTGIDGWTTLETVRQIDPQKFAELIAQECKNVLLDMMDEGQGESDTLDQALTEINEHFGFDNE